jgi:hypothetical protein
MSETRPTCTVVVYNITIQPIASVHHFTIFLILFQYYNFFSFCTHQNKNKEQKKKKKKAKSQLTQQLKLEKNKNKAKQML